MREGQEGDQAGDEERINEPALLQAFAQVLAGPHPQHVVPVSLAVQSAACHKIGAKFQHRYVEQVKRQNLDFKSRNRCLFKDKR